MDIGEIGCEDGRFVSSGGLWH